MTMLEERDADRLPPPDAEEAAPARDVDGRAARRRNVVAEIAERRRADIREEMARLTIDDHLALAAATPPPRPIVDRLAAPGLHLIAEIKRSSPSAGEIAGPDEDIVARARAYEASGAAAISVLCEPHWFGGSVEDLRAVEPASLGPDHCELEAEKVGRRKQDAVGINRDLSEKRNRPGELNESWIHGYLHRAYREL